jgi:hypothetical protein
MALHVPVEEGDCICCERCGRTRIVKNYVWKMPVQVIVCDEGIHVVGIEHERVLQHTIVDYLRLGETA